MNSKARRGVGCLLTVAATVAVFARCTSSAAHPQREAPLSGLVSTTPYERLSNYEGPHTLTARTHAPMRPPRLFGTDGIHQRIDYTIHSSPEYSAGDVAAEMGAGADRKSRMFPAPHQFDAHAIATKDDAELRVAFETDSGFVPVHRERLAREFSRGTTLRARCTELATDGTTDFVFASIQQPTGGNTVYTGRARVKTWMNGDEVECNIEARPGSLSAVELSALGLQR